MNPGARLILGALMVSVAVGYLAYVGASRSWQYYLSVDETMADSATLTGKTIRISGRVADGSLKISEHRRDAEFRLIGAHEQLSVSCHGTMPDNLAEGIEVVVEGRLQADGFQGDKVITRCASKYEPKDSLALKDETSAKLPPR